MLDLQRGQKILIHAGAGGVGTFAIQLAKQMGAYVATTASDKGYELVKSLGADEIINYRKQQFEELLSGYDAVYDTLGGEVLEKSFRILKPGGRIVSISGMPNARFGRDEGLGWMKRVILSIVSRKLTALEKATGTSYRYLFMKPSGAQLAILKDLIEARHIKPVIDKVYPLKDASDAMDYLASGTAKGKVIISMK